MRRDKAPVLSRKLGRCDSCYRQCHLFRLKYVLREWLLPTANNIFLYSSYNSSFWTVDTASDAGTISFNSDDCRYRVNLDDTATDPTQSTTEIGGAQTWAGTGVFRNSTSVDISSAATNVVFAADFGFYHAESDRSGTFEMGFTDSSGSQFSSQLSLTPRSGHQRYWFSTAVGSIPGWVTTATAYLYLKFTQNSAGQKWFVDRLQLETDVSKPGTFAITTGTAVSRIDAKTTGKAAVCPDCYDGIHKRSELRGRPRIVPPDVIESEETDY